MSLKPVTDTGTVLFRELRPMVRDPFSLIFSLVQPLVFLVLFGPLLSDVPGVTGESPWQWFVPGILVMIGLFGTSMCGANLLYEMQTGSHERLLVTPLGRSPLLVGRALKEIVALVVQAALVVLALLPFGFRLYPLGALVGLAILALFGVGMGSLSYALAIAVKSKEWMFYAVQQSLIFPLLILSGMLLPLEMGPSWLLTLARFNPLKHVVDAERVLFAGQFGSMSVVWGTLSAVLLAIVGLAVGTRAMRRASV